MDSQTHVEFADQLLAIAGRPAGCAVASLFPQIDRHPHVFHRMYAHTVLSLDRISDDMVEPAMQAMQLEASRSPAVVRCCDFLANFERVLVDLHIRHLEAAEAETIGSGDERLEAVAG
jgi:hypothetical protein